MRKGIFNGCDSEALEHYPWRRKPRLPPDIIPCLDFACSGKSKITKNDESRQANLTGGGWCGDGARAAVIPAFGPLDGEFLGSAQFRPIDAGGFTGR